MSEHTDAGMRCLVAHLKDGKIQPACVKCSCGEWVPGTEWEEHRTQIPLTPDERAQTVYRYE